MRIIDKYEFKEGEIIQLPANANIIKASPAFIWAVVDLEEKDTVDLKCVIVEDMEPLPEDMDTNWIYLDTFCDNIFVRHHYLVLKEKKDGENTGEPSETEAIG